MSHKRLKRKKSLSGFMLLDAFIALGLTLSIAASVYWLYARYQHINQAIAQANNLTTVSNASGTYMTVYFTPLVNGTAVTGVANEYAPTISELVGLGLLPSTFSATNNYGGGYTVAVSKVPSGCVAPSCDLSSLANLTNAITDPITKTVDTVALGSAAQAAGGNAGYSTPSVPGTISGLQGAWSAPNPAGSVAGILAMRAGYGSSGMAQFTRRDGSAPPTANWNMNNYSVTGINALGSTTLATSGAAAIGGALNVTGQTTTAGITNNGALTNTGNETVSGTLGVSGQTTTKGISNTGTLANSGNMTNTGSLTNSGAVSVGSTLSVTGATTTNGITNTGNINNSGDVITGRLDLTTIVVAGTPCMGLDGYQAATAAGSIASCINNIWTTPNATTAVSPPCSTTTLSWGSSCSASFPATPSGLTSSQSSTAIQGSGSATFLCTAGSWVLSTSSCAASCPSGTNLSWSSGSCQGPTTSWTYSGSQAYVSSTTGTGSAYFTCSNGSFGGAASSSCAAQCAATSKTWGSPASCGNSLPLTSSGNSVTISSNTTSSGSSTWSCNNGTWSATSSSCTPPPCSGTYTWGSSHCSASYYLASGAQSTFSSATTSGSYGKYSGTATLSCTNGVMSAVGSAECDLTDPWPMVTNTAAGAAVTSMYLSPGSPSFNSYCSTIYPGSTGSTTLSQTYDEHQNAVWTCWTNSGTTCAVPDATDCGIQNGCSCASYATIGGGAGSCFVTASLVCQHYGL